jgi:hypothetical protein
MPHRLSFMKLKILNIHRHRPSLHHRTASAPYLTPIKRPWEPIDPPPLLVLTLAPHLLAPSLPLMSSNRRPDNSMPSPSTFAADEDHHYSLFPLRRGEPLAIGAPFWRHSSVSAASWSKRAAKGHHPFISIQSWPSNPYSRADIITLKGYADLVHHWL